MTPPRFDELVGEDVAPEERERLRRVHDLLILAGPPPEAPPRALATRPRALARRRLTQTLLAAALAAAAFGGGWLARDARDDFDLRQEVAMRGTENAPRASATIALGKPDEEGNWEMIVTASGLKPLPEDGYYVLELTIDGEPVATCGSFKVDESGTARVRLGASYSLDEFDGWVVRPYIHGRERLNETVVLETEQT